LIPASRSASQYYSKANLALPKEYDEFMNKYPDGCMIAAFGTTFQPKDGTIEELVEAAR